MEAVRSLPRNCVKLLEVRNFIVFLLISKELLADEKFKEIDKTYWENMIKEADKNGDGEV